MTFTITVLGVASVLSILFALYVLFGTFILGIMDAGFNWEAVLSAPLCAVLGAIAFCLIYVIAAGLAATF